MRTVTCDKCGKTVADSLAHNTYITVKVYDYDTVDLCMARDLCKECGEKISRFFDNDCFDIVMVDRKENVENAGN